MPNYYALNMDCSKSVLNGDFQPYHYSGTPITYPNNPQGQVWWVSTDGAATWNTVAASSPNQPGNPKLARPTVLNGDTVWVAIRDQNNTISGVTVVVVFGRRPGKAGQAPIASPFQNLAGGLGAVFDQTTFTGQAIGIQGAGQQWWVYNLPAVTYPGGGSFNVNFGCYVGAVVTYSDGTQRQFGIDPEMEVDDYSGSGRGRVRNPLKD